MAIVNALPALLVDGHWTSGDSGVLATQRLGIVSARPQIIILYVYPWTM